MNVECEKTGWIKLYRCIMESPIWQKPDYFRVFMWCIAKANHKDNKFPFNGNDITIKRGQFITGYKEALQELKPFTRQTYRSALTYLKSTNRINQQTTNKFSIITVCNYDIYQSLENEGQQLNQPASNKPVTNQQPTSNHKQECKEFKECKEISLLDAKILKFKKDVFTEENIKRYGSPMLQEFFQVWADVRGGELRYEFNKETFTSIDNMLSRWGNLRKRYIKL